MSIEAKELTAAELAGIAEKMRGDHYCNALFAHIAHLEQELRDAQGKLWAHRSAHIMRVMMATGRNFDDVAAEYDHVMEHGCSPAPPEPCAACGGSGWRRGANLGTVAMPSGMVCSASCPACNGTGKADPTPISGNAPDARSAR